MPDFGPVLSTYAHDLSTKLPAMTSKRLTYQPVTPDRLDDFHSLVQDDHVRRYNLPSPHTV